MTCPHPKPSKNSKRCNKCAYEHRRVKAKERHRKAMEVKGGWSEPKQQVVELFASVGAWPQS
jgi:hypothetical protein